MWAQRQSLASDPAEWLGDIHPLVEQLGSAAGLVSVPAVCAALQLPVIRDYASLREFLGGYHVQVLRPHELPAIHRAFVFGEQRALRELVALDRELAGSLPLQHFGEASRRVGRAHLERLRPLRDERIIRRYQAAVEASEADGWHTLVYGLTLALYSAPLRQGLLAYAQQTTRGFIQRCAAPLQLTERECRTLFDLVCSGLPGFVEHGLLAGPVAAPEVPPRS